MSVTTDWLFPSTVVESESHGFTDPENVLADDSSYAVSTKDYQGRHLMYLTFFGPGYGHIVDSGLSSTESYVIKRHFDTVLDGPITLDVLLNGDPQIEIESDAPPEGGTFDAIFVGGFDFSSISDGADVNWVEVRVHHKLVSGDYYVNSLSLRVNYTDAVSPDSIPSGEAFGGLTLSIPPVSIAPVSIAPGEAFGGFTTGMFASDFGDISSGEAFGDTGIVQSPPPPPPPQDWTAIGKEDEKEYVYKVYDADGNYIGVWTDVSDSLGFTQQINTPGTTTTVQLSRSANTTKEVRDSLVDQGSDPITTEDGEALTILYETSNTVGEDTDVDLNYNVDVYVHYGEFVELTTQDGITLTTEDEEALQVASGFPLGVRVFSGFIMDYESVYGEESAGVTVTLASHGHELSNELIRDGETTTVTYSGTEIGAGVKDILDDNPGKMGYDSASIENTGVSPTLKFQLNTKLEGIQTYFDQTPDNWYWYGNVADNNVYLKETSATADHTFLLGKHIKSVRVKRSIESLKNVVYFVGGEVTPGTPSSTLFKKYEDTTSQADWRKGLERITDRRYTLAASALNRANKTLSRYKNPIFATPLVISSGRYDIESIKLGETVGFGNFGNFIDDVMLQIVSRSYTPTEVTLELGELQERQLDAIAELGSDLANEQYETLPTAPS